ncbi:amino acid/amide ABC transporter substrate-binding protein, HAAT family [Thermaerobacter subterraneus DSM 13965]|uniref:Amino acid/amide ABC transporter substrate-binding protein, HAAT family n=1 Tax=Thermaerobacter subterraneus DSM 13965 TaxID=867903 RepID=K6NZF5_9FIRM|nr:amino acid/amide ABC transporter substrate-binding protein, HAAT family [Thermaerobacter subterraneus DSM 13965]
MFGGTWLRGARRGMVALLAGALMVGTAACGGAGGGAGSGNSGSSDKIVIGVQGPFTGDYAAEGKGFRQAIELVKEQVNAQGGVLGKQIEVIYEDDKGQPNESTLAAQKLASQGVVAVIGSYNSTATEAAQQVYADAGILHITPSSTATHLTEKGLKNFFRMAFLDSAQGQFAATLLVDKLGARKVALVHDSSTYAEGLAKWTRKFLEEKGAQVVFYDAINPQESDYSALLSNLKSTNPDAIYFTGYFSQAGLLVKQARDLGITVPIAAGNASNNDEVIKTAGAAAEGFITTTEPAPADLPYEEARQFVQDYKAKYNEDPVSIWTAMAADSFRVIVEAIKQTQSTDPAKLADYLRNDLEAFPGISGPITFDDKGDREGTVYAAYQVKDGKFTLFVPPQQ